MLFPVCFKPTGSQVSDSDNTGDATVLDGAFEIGSDASCEGTSGIVVLIPISTYVP